MRFKLDEEVYEITQAKNEDLNKVLERLVMQHRGYRQKGRSNYQKRYPLKEVTHIHGSHSKYEIILQI
ncbi:MULTISPECIES: hypothetical protein [unclassified Rossellomorea]|uniref:hypothetical protein n=1 Tax=unclassified Rossellomorea TaxID=2837526 RepID=UPI002602F5B4|nr:hypothetical protein [uncultured Rossellomorea sp.]